MNNQANFYFTPDGDLIGTKKPISQSGYFRPIDSDTVMSIDGDKYRFTGEGQKAERVKIR